MTLVEQTEYLEAVGCRTIVSLDALSREKIVRMIRERTALKVMFASFLIEPTKRGAVRRLNDYQQFTEHLANLPRKCHGYVMDVDSGFLAETPAERRVMLGYVRAQITRDLRGRVSRENAKRGAPHKDFTPEQIDVARQIWENVRRYPSWEAAKAGFDERVKGFTVWRANRMFGKRED